QKEYDFWMDGCERLDKDEPDYRRVVRLPDGTVLNRYWDDRATPRPEAYAEDVELAKEAKEKHGHEPESVYRCLRAAAESGWDFSSRWMADGKTFATIQTTNILPVDLNCLMHHLESTLAEAYQLGNYPDLALDYAQKASRRKTAIDTCFWDEERKFYMDYDYQQQKFTDTFSLAAVFPLYFKLANTQQARAVKSKLRVKFLRSGGMLTTLTNSGQQWDKPNGWAPLQWMTYRGLRNYHFNRTAAKLQTSWLHVVEKQYKSLGKILEKYNIVHTNLLPCDGEYEIQEGFGWTNGVYLALKNEGKVGMQTDTSERVSG
uniref:trehalase family glycosidase n=1 Tax=Persicitalea sp. TaxID=3100273 RepID=UPI0035942CFA